MVEESRLSHRPLRPWKNLALTWIEMGSYWKHWLSTICIFIIKIAYKGSFFIKIFLAAIWR